MLHVCVLGEQSIADERTANVTHVRIRSSRTVALIGFLAAHSGSPQTRQRIAGLFWPESADGQALTNLRRELHNLRQIIGDDPSLVVTSRDLCWRDSESCRVDMRVFDSERMAALAAAANGDTAAALAHGDAAIGQYRGEFLPGSYDDWLLEIRSELERRCADLCDLISETRAGSGDLTGAAAAARRRILLQPLEEAGYRMLMRLQADLGDRAGALSTYHHCASVLERELGVVPDGATQELLERLMSPAERAAEPREVRPPAQAGSRGPAGGRVCAAGRPGARAGPAAVQVARGGRRAAGPGRRARRRGSRQVPAGGGRGRAGQAPGRRRCRHPVFRDAGAARARAGG